MNRKRFGYVLAWLVAAALAIVVGLAAVSTVGASIRGRGPLGNDVVRDVGRGDNVVTADPDVRMQRDNVTGDFGTFAVGCRGVVAYGLAVDPTEGWDVVSYEEGPDDDVDAIFASRAEHRSIDIEVFCNRGRPEVDDIEDNTLPDD